MRCLIILFLLCSCGNGYRKINFLEGLGGYSDQYSAKDSYDIQYKIDYTRPPEDCLDMALMRSAQIGLEKNKNILISDLKITRKKDELREMLLDAIFVSTALLSKGDSSYQGMHYSHYNQDTKSNYNLYTNLKLSLSSDVGTSPCAICKILYSKNKKLYKKDICNCNASNLEIEEAQQFLRTIFYKMLAPLSYLNQTR